MLRAGRSHFSVKHIRLFIDGVESDQSGSLQLVEPTGNVGLADLVDAKWETRGAEDRRAPVEPSVVVDHRHQAAIEHLSRRRQTVDGVTGQDAFSEDSVRH
jgi:hypothetical protein